MVLALTRPRWHTPFSIVQREIDQLFNEVFRGGDGNSPAKSTWLAPASLWEDDGYFYVEVELPGVKSEQLDVTVDKGTLKIAAERPAPEGERKYWHQERGYGRVERVVTLPETADGETIEAGLSDGVLAIRFAKKIEAQPKKIAVKNS